MKNNFDLKDYMKSNKVGSYQQLNEMWYQDINQALGDFNVIKEEAIEETPLHPDTEEDENGNTYFTEDEMEEGKKKLAFVIPCPDAYDIEEEAEHFQYLLDKAGVKAKVKANQVGEEAEVYTKDEKKARKVIEKNGYQIGWTEDNELEEMGGVKTIEEIKFDDAIVPIKQTMQSLGYKGEYDPFVEEGYIFEKDFADGVMRISITALNDDQEKFTFTAVHFDRITKSQLFGLIKKHVIDYRNGNWVSKDGDVEIVDLGTGMFSLDKPGVQDLIKKTVQRVEDKAVATKGIDEMAGDNVKSLGAGKMAHANTRVNLGRHRSSDTLDKQVAKDHDKNTIKGAKAAAYKAPHMKEEETADDIFAGSDTANWKDNYGNETSEWDTEIAGQTINGWTAEETQGGAIAWQNPRYPNADIYATPGWEGVDGIALELHDSEDGYMDEPKIQKVVGAGTDLWKTKEGYMALMAKVFTTLEKMLTPSEEMAEDDGTGRQINHDFNDDISIDHSEFEDTISEGMQDWNHTFEEDIMDLLDDGISKPEILTHFTDILKIARPRMEESIENEDADPFGSIKTGIDNITQGNDDMDMSDDDRFDQLGGDKIKAGIESLMGDGFDYREILQFVKDTIASKRNY